MAQTALSDYYLRKTSVNSSVPAEVKTKEEADVFFYSDDFLGRLNRRFAKSKVIRWLAVCNAAVVSLLCAQQCWCRRATPRWVAVA